MIGETTWKESSGFLKGRERFDAVQPIPGEGLVGTGILGTL
jgi:hypothetical protein